MAPKMHGRNSEEVWSTPRVAEFLGLDRSTVYRMRTVLNGRPIGGGGERVRWGFPASSVIEFQRARAVEALEVGRARARRSK